MFLIRSLHSGAERQDKGTDHGSLGCRRGFGFSVD